MTSRNHWYRDERVRSPRNQGSRNEHAFSVRKPVRATAIVFEEDRVLLVRYKLADKFNLPGAMVDSDEPLLVRTARALQEDTGLNAVDPKHVAFHTTPHVRHALVIMKTEGEILLGEKIEEYIWWDTKSEVSLETHAHAILSMKAVVAPKQPKASVDIEYAKDEVVLPQNPRENSNIWRRLFRKK